jgi:hypothetical protein
MVATAAENRLIARGCGHACAFKGEAALTLSNISGLRSALHEHLVDIYKCALGCTVKCQEPAFTVHWRAP